MHEVHPVSLCCNSTGALHGEGLAEGAASDERQKESALSKSSLPSDGIEGLFDGCELRFGRDKRLEEVHSSVNYLCSEVAHAYMHTLHNHEQKKYKFRWFIVDCAPHGTAGKQ